MSYFLLTLLMIVGLFLMAVILLQRGRGGGLAGAFGGLGGQSAFGTRAGDTFTWITVVTVLLWVILAALTGRSMRSDQSFFSGREADDVEVSSDKSKSEADEKGAGGSPDADTDRAAGLDLPSRPAGTGDGSTPGPDENSPAGKTGPAREGLTAPPDDEPAESSDAESTEDSGN